FKGMPNKRWWHFEPGGTDFGDVQVDRRDLAKLVVMDFMLVHGNDWFVIRFEMETGTLCRVTSLEVRDVFGGVTAIQRADTGVPSPGGAGPCIRPRSRGARTSPTSSFSLLPRARSSSPASPSRRSDSSATRWRTWSGPWNTPS